MTLNLFNRLNATSKFVSHSTCEIECFPFLFYAIFLDKYMITYFIYFVKNLVLDFQITFCQFSSNYY